MRVSRSSIGRCLTKEWVSVAKEVEPGVVGIITPAIVGVLIGGAGGGGGGMRAHA